MLDNSDRTNAAERTARIRRYRNRRTAATTRQPTLWNIISSAVRGLLSSGDDSDVRDAPRPRRHVEWPAVEELPPFVSPAAPILQHSNPHPPVPVVQPPALPAPLPVQAPHNTNYGQGSGPTFSAPFSNPASFYFSGTSTSTSTLSEESSSSSVSFESGCWSPETGWTPCPSLEPSHDEDNHSDAGSDITLCEENEWPLAKRRRVNPIPPTVALTHLSPTYATPSRRVRHSRADNEERRTRRELMRRLRDRLPPIGPPGVRIGGAPGPEPAPTPISQSRVPRSGVVEASAQPVAGPSRPLRRRGQHVQVPGPSLRPRKRSRDEDGTSETGAGHQDGEGRDRDGQRKKRRTRRSKKD
ncbi:hypothetical protein L227DRAFT_657716 [Lentinus tigrinus ALCF2SS1-6]|uniref:Uncharacterized protein n=1 Tax=Lentinus tigrinus ALCF2SS1-6 TaxID=1328759 RepID=A0A5C2RTE5_9APHY|nr:hypothetical protein L227DRAFT_657716 [Lentinus tigrinus ALCF2SS1-6]